MRESTPKQKTANRLFAAVQGDTAGARWLRSFVGVKESPSQIIELMEGA